MDSAMHDGDDAPGRTPSETAAPQNTPPGRAVPYRNPYAEPSAGEIPPGGTSADGNPEHHGPKAEPDRFSGWAIAGIVIASFGWALAALPLIYWIDSLGDGGMDTFFNSIGALGVFAFAVSVVGFIAARRAGRRKLAARLYIIPSLTWQLPLLAGIVWILILLSSYEPY